MKTHHATQCLNKVETNLNFLVIDVMSTKSVLIFGKSAASFQFWSAKVSSFSQTSLKNLPKTENLNFKQEVIDKFEYFEHQLLFYFTLKNW